MPWPMGPWRACCCFFFFGLVCVYFLGIISGSSEAVSLENLVQLQKLLSQATPVDSFSLPGFVSYSILFFLRRILTEKNID